MGYYNILQKEAVGYRRQKRKKVKGGELNLERSEKAIPQTSSMMQNKKNTSYQEQLSKDCLEEDCKSLSSIKTE